MPFYLLESKLLDTIKADFNLKTDAEMAKFIKMPPSMISKLRSKSSLLTSEMILRIYDSTGWSIEKIRELWATQK
jgi:plasmid maintenance system antidote protein VapI